MGRGAASKPQGSTGPGARPMIGASAGPSAPPIDPVAECLPLFRALPASVQAVLSERFAGHRRSPATDRAWCDAVRQASRAPASGGRVAPAAGTRIPMGGAECLARGGTYFADGTPGCVLPEGDDGGGAGQGGGGDRPGGQPQRFADDSACLGAGGTVAGTGDDRMCTTADGRSVPIGPAETDHTADYLRVVGGAILGITGAVTAYLTGEQRNDLAVRLAELQQRQQAANALAARDANAATTELARINLQIAQLRDRAVTTAQNQGYRPPAPTPPWVYVAGGVAVAGVLYLLYDRAQKRPLPYEARGGRY